MTKNISIHEGVVGYYFYHIAIDDKPLCGVAKFVDYRNQHTMQTTIPLSAWGTITHLQERYCKRCEEKAKKLGLI